ncbi:hypothetical protein Tco_0086595 [Tanacetum coccineum]
MLSMQNKNDLALKNKNNGKLSNASKTNFHNDTSNGNNKWKFSSPTRFKTPPETPSFKNQWKIKRNFKSPLIPRELFSNETPVSSPRWNSTSLHRIDTTSKWFSKLGKPVSTVLKWVPKKHEHRHIHSFISHIQSSKIHFRNSDKSKNFLKTSKLLIKTKVLHEEDCKVSRKYEYVGQKLQKTNQDGFTVKNDDMARSQRERQKGKWKDQDQDH